MRTRKTRIDGGTRWRWYAEPDEATEYLALATIIELDSVWSLPRFQWHSQRIHRQLERTPGLVGFSVRARLPRRYWTLSVWANGRALRDFVKGSSHERVITAFPRTMQRFRHVHWKVKGAALPPLWAEGLRRLEPAPPASDRDPDRQL
jgi:hypothetical protein